MRDDSAHELPTTDRSGSTRTGQGFPPSPQRRHDRIVDGRARTGGRFDGLGFLAAKSHTPLPLLRCGTSRVRVAYLAADACLGDGDVGDLRRVDGGGVVVEEDEVGVFADFE